MKALQVYRSQRQPPGTLPATFFNPQSLPLMPPRRPAATRRR